jgi:hypothetical protein
MNISCRLGNEEPEDNIIGRFLSLPVYPVIQNISIQFKNKYRGKRKRKKKRKFKIIVAGGQEGSPSLPIRANRRDFACKFRACASAFL